MCYDVIASQKQSPNKGNRSQKVMLWLASNWMCGFKAIEPLNSPKPEKTRL
jgi:hypothetical protein